ncbi:MAG: AAA family ATPase [Planctomycetaceae bacterium]
MSTSAALDQIRSRITAGYPLLVLRTWEEARWERALGELALEIDCGLVVWSATHGALPPPAGDAGDAADPRAFLDRIEAYPPDHLFLLKDFHPYLADPGILRRLRDLALALPAQRKALLLIGPAAEVPADIAKDAVEIDLPLPGLEELGEELRTVLATERVDAGLPRDVSAADQERLLKALLGLTAHEARRALYLALQGRASVDDDVQKTLVAEKRHLIAGSELLEFCDLDEGVRDVGGLEVLKAWLAQRVEAFSERAREQGIPLPKGVLLLGIQGCGKSLTARAAARLLGFPLVRLDVSNLLSSDRGASEHNLRDVLNLIETIAPAVLWLDEIEKGFAGVGTESDAVQDAVMTRLVGSFLAWMESRKTPVFVVATANSVAHLPPEMVRRGRFDELFFVDLPNYHERKEILAIHLAKRGWKPEKYDVGALASKTEGYSGAELEQIVVSAMIDAYGQGRLLAQEDLEKSRDQTVPLSVTMEEKVFELREWAATRCRRATSDSRVTQMLEEEQRLSPAAAEDDNAETKPGWLRLAEHGQVRAALVDYLRLVGAATFPKLQQDFACVMPTTGEIGLGLKSDPNVVLWSGLSPEFAELLSTLVANKRIYLNPTDVETYKPTGKLPPLPVVTKLTDQRQPRPAWLPVVFKLAPPAGGSGKFGRVTRIRLKR